MVHVLCKIYYEFLRLNSVKHKKNDTPLYSNCKNIKIYILRTIIVFESKFE